MNATLYILCGPAFSGKSTLAAALARHAGASVVSLDEINARRGLFGGEGIPPAEWARSHEIARGEISAMMRKGVPRIVVDDTNCYRFLRDAFRETASQNGYDPVLVVLSTPLELIRERADLNRSIGNRGGIREAVLEEHLASFEWPLLDEPHLTCEPSNDLEVWIKTKLLAGWCPFSGRSGEQ